MLHMIPRATCEGQDSQISVSHRKVWSRERWSVTEALVRALRFSDGVQHFQPKHGPKLL